MSDAGEARRPRRVLIVDDSRAMRLVMIRALRQAGFVDCEVLEADDGTAAFETVQTRAPDLVLSDWHMPRMSGIELLQALRRSGEHARFGFVTADATPAMHETAQQLGAAFVIAKPVDPEVLRDVLTPAEPSPEPEMSAAVETLLPGHKNVRDLLGSLFGRDVSLAPGYALVPTTRLPCAVTTYVGARLTVSAVVVADLAFVAYAGAALVLLPANISRSVVTTQVLPDNVFANFREVMNVMRGLFAHGATGARLYAVSRPGDAVPADITKLARSVTCREDFEVTISGYGVGHLSIVIPDR